MHFTCQMCKMCVNQKLLSVEDCAKSNAKRGVCPWLLGWAMPRLLWGAESLFNMNSRRCIPVVYVAAAPAPEGRRGVFMVGAVAGSPPPTLYIYIYIFQPPRQPVQRLGLQWQGKKQAAFRRQKGYCIFLRDVVQ